MVIPEREVARVTDHFSELEREIVLISVLFFKVKRDRLKIANDAVEVVEIPQDPAAPEGLKALRWVFAQMREEKSDIEGDVVGFFTRTILEHPQMATYFYLLNPRMISNICYNLDEMFENQEWCAQCEGWSYYQQDPEEFHISAAADMIFLCNGFGGFGIPEMRKWSNYYPTMGVEIVKKILGSYSKENLLALFAPKEDGGE